MKNIRELCLKRESTDSIKEQESLEEEIAEMCDQYLTLIYTESENAGIKLPIFDSSDFRVDSGCVKYYSSCSSKVKVTYEDFWSYGGHCKEFFHLKFEKMEKFDLQEFKKSCQQNKKEELARKVNSAKLILENAQAELDNFNEN